jgi:type VI secretion system FHA domain protein
MNLTLEVISANGSRLGAGRRKVFGAEGGRIGRGNDCDWILPSPARYVSRHHASIQFRYGQFYVTPEGENSVAVNNPNAVLAFGESRQLKQGERIYIDEYEILASLSNESYASPIVGDPFAEVLGADVPGPLIEGPDPQSVDPLAGLPGGDEKPIAPMFIDLPQGSLLDEPFVPPPRIAAESPPAPPRYVPTRSATHSGSQPKLVIPSDPNAWNQPDFDNGLSQTAAYAPTPIVPPRSAPPLPPPAPVRDPAPKVGRLPVPPPAAIAPPAPVARPAPPRAPPKPQPGPAAVAPASAAGAFDIEAMLRAAGVDPATVAPETAATLGEILMIVVQGTIDALRAREEVKSQFRLAVTRVKAAQNNPLTFALDAKDAMQSLLTRQNAAFLPPVEAFQRAFDDIRTHQMAMLAGMRAGFEQLLERFDPEQLQENFDRQAKRSAVLGMGKPKYWELYADYYAALRGDRDDAFRRLFGEEFAQAYEKQVELIRHTRGTKSQ